MKIQLLLIILLFTALNALGQTKKAFYGVSASADWNSYVLVQDVGANDYKGRPNFSAGAIARYNLSERLSMDGGIYYSTKNFREKVDFSKYRAINPNDPLLISDQEAKILHNQYFLDIPLGLNYNLIKNNTIDFYTTLGIIGSKLLSYQYESNAEEFDNPSNNVSYNDFLGSIKIGLGTLIKTNQIGINIEPQFRLFMTKVHKEGIEENPIHFGIQVSVLKL